MKTVLCFILLLSMLILHSQELRIVSLSPALTELVYHLGSGDRLVGRSEVCDFPEEVKALPIVGRFADPNVEAVLSLKPTLVITNDLINPGVIATFRKAGIQTEMLQCRTIAEYRDCVEKLGTLLQQESVAKQELERIDHEITVQCTVQSYYVLWVVWDSPLMIAGANSLPNEILRLVGVKNVAGDISQAYFKCSFDWLLGRKIDAIVWTASPNGWRKHRFWRNLSAVQNNQIIADIDPNLLQRPGPRILDGVQVLRERLRTLR